MTHDERITYLKRLDKETISPTELARVIGGNPYVYNVAAKEGLLTLPYIWRGRNLRAALRLRDKQVLPLQNR